MTHALSPVEPQFFQRKWSDMEMAMKLELKVELEMEQTDEDGEVIETDPEGADEILDTAHSAIQDTLSAEIDVRWPECFAGTGCFAIFKSAKVTRL